MANTNIIQKILAISPHVEMIVRRIYWGNIGRVKINKKRAQRKSSKQKIDFSNIKKYLHESGIDKGSLLLVHSAYSPFHRGGMRAEEVVNELLDLVGTYGTLAMPAMPKFKNSPIVEKYLESDHSGTVFEYDVQKSKIKTGVLPLILHRKPGSIRSRHPINSMVAFGPLGESLMADNLLGESPLPCGIESSWYRCVENDAIILGLGTDLTHSLTMIHVAEDAYNSDWPVDDWYLEKKFLIKDGDFEKRIVLRERSPKWGALHFGERTLCKDLIKRGILKSRVIEGVLVEVIFARELISYLRSRNGNGYPYYWLPHD